MNVQVSEGIHCACLCLMLSFESEVHTRENGLGVEVEDAVHLASHGESAAVAYTVCVAHTFGRTAAVGEDKIGYPAVSVGADDTVSTHFHRTQSADGVHDRIAATLIVDERINQPVTYLVVEVESFRLLEGRVEIQGYLVDVRIVVDILQRFLYARVVAVVDA